MRIGHGYDIHRLVEGRPLVLGGVVIPYEKGLEGHSDADALLHALCDAILGAMAEGDIGHHFPDSDAEFKNIDSRILLRQVFELMNKKKYVLLNSDITILAEAPKMAPYLSKMKEVIANDLRIEHEQINIKATTNEKMDCIGRGEGIAVHAVVLLNFLT